MTGEPTHLAALVRWFMLAAQDDIPVRIHSRETAEDGDPEWHASFRSWLMAHPAAVDREGHVKSAFRYWLYVMHGEGRDNRVGAEFLYRMACLDGDWLAAARTITPLTRDGETMARAFAFVTIKRFWRYMDRALPDPKSASSRQHRADCAEQGCPTKTTHYRCPEHEVRA